MKWLVAVGVVLCVHSIRAGVLKCIPGSKDEPCTRDVRTLKKSDLLFGKECLPGTKWTSQCNECICSDDGLPSCTEKVCEGQEKDLTLRCAPDTIWKYECNTCWCTSIGHAMCTRIGCNAHVVTNFNPDGGKEKNETTVTSINLDGLEEKFTEESPVNKTSVRKTRATSQASSRSESSSSRFQHNVKETPKACQPGQEFRMDCNTCLCNNEGQDYSCTRIDCNALNNNNNGGARRKREVTSQVTTECTPGSVFQQGCKVCRCSQDGRHAICPMHCQKDKEHSENDISTESDPSFRCNPGETFRRFCNDCTCSADGRSVFCTLRLCEEEITPTI